VRFLIAESDPGLSLMLEQLAARWGAGTDIVEDGHAAWRLLQAGDERLVVIADQALRGLDGLTLCEMLRQTTRGTACHFILLASGDALDIARAVQAGVDDILLRPFDPHLLDLRLRTVRTIFGLRAEAAAAERAVRAQATRDPLTGALNLQAILAVLDREASRAARDGTSLAVLVVAVDGLARIRDWHGEEVADQVLTEIGRRVERLLRPYDGLGRLGDDEFLVVLPMCDAARAGGVAARVRNHIATDPVLTRVRPVSMTASVGVAATAAGAGPREALLAAARENACQARDAGGNRVGPAS
jgi:two-component system, cell cycle response regulator